MIKIKFFLDLLMRLFTEPFGLDGRGKLFEAVIWQQFRQIVFLLPCRPAFVDELNLLARHALHTLVTHAMFVAVRKATASSGERICDRPFVPRRQLILCHFASANTA